MAIEVPKEKKKNSWLWLGALVLVLIAGYFLWKIFLPSVKLTTKSDVSQLVGPTTEQVQRLDLNIDKIINNPIFQTLKSHLGAPLVTGPLGRSNPFIPF